MGAETFVIAGSGPSLAAWQCMAVGARARVIAVNTSYRMFRSGVLYACDGAWWRVHHRDVIGFERWTQDAAAADEYGLTHVECVEGEGLCRAPGRVHSGGNGGYQAIGLAWLMGARRILLIGFDMQLTGGKTHWHGDHPAGLNNCQPIADWPARFGPLAEDLRAEGVEAINCSLDTALTCFPRGDIRAAL